MTTPAQRIARLEALRPTFETASSDPSAADAFRQRFRDMCDRSPVTALHYPPAELAEALGRALEQLGDSIADLDHSIAETDAGTWPSWCRTPAKRSQHAASVRSHRSALVKVAGLLEKCHAAAAADAAAGYLPKPIPPEALRFALPPSNLSTMELLALFVATPGETQ